MRKIKIVFLILANILFGAFLVIFYLSAADGRSADFTPNKMEFACLKKRFEADQYYVWVVKESRKEYFEISGRFLLGRYSPLRIHITLDSDFFELPEEKRVPGTEIMFLDIHYKPGIEEPVCATDNEDFVKLTN